MSMGLMSAASTRRLDNKKPIWFDRLKLESNSLEQRTLYHLFESLLLLPLHRVSHAALWSLIRQGVRMLGLRKRNIGITINTDLF